MSLYVYSGQAQEDVEGQESVGELAIARVPCQQHAYGADADMRAWEGCCGAFACCLGVFYEMIEYAVGIAWCGQAVGAVVEIVVHGWKNTFGYVAQSYGMIVERWSGYGHEDKYYIIDDKRGVDYECGTLELSVSAEEVVVSHNDHHGIVHHVAQVHQLAHDDPGHVLGKHQCWLESE